MVKQIIGGILEELETTAGQIVKQAGQTTKGIASDAAKQVTGQPSSGDNSNSQQWEQIVGKPIDPTQMQKMEQEAKIKEERNKAAIRRNLQSLMEAPREQQQEPPKYVKAQVEKQKKMQEIQEKEKKKPPPLQVRSAQGKASGETRAGWGVGG